MARRSVRESRRARRQGARGGRPSTHRKRRGLSLVLLVMLGGIIAAIAFLNQYANDRPALGGDASTRSSDRQPLKQLNITKEDMWVLPQPTLPKMPIELAGQTFKLELATDGTARYWGLSNRPSIAADGGMLFVFPEPRPLSFVMRQCLVPIDLVFVDSEGRITALHEMQVEPRGTRDTQLRPYPSHDPAQFAFELRAGTIDRLGLKVGQQLNLPLDRLKAKAR